MSESRCHALQQALESKDAKILDPNEVAYNFNTPSNAFTQTDYINRLCVSHELLRQQLDDIRYEKDQG